MRDTALLLVPRSIDAPYDVFIYSIIFIGVWRSLVAHSLGVRVVGRSNRLTPTIVQSRNSKELRFFLFRLLP